MQTDQQQTGSEPGGLDVSEKSAGQPEIPTTEGDTVRTPRKPAKLPKHSQAAAAQRMEDRPEYQPPGFFYEVAHHRQHPLGWNIKRHLKRRNLRGTNVSTKATDRSSMRTIFSISGILLSVFLVTVLVFISYTTFVSITNKSYSSKVTTLEDILPRDSLKVYDADNRMIYQQLDQGLQTSEPLNKISPDLANAEVAIEDQNFYKNSGYDITGIVRAAIEDLSSGHVVSGGSTITQQLIKNTMVGNQDTALRKLQEIILAPEVTRYYTKDQILDMYLNTTYYGEQSAGGLQMYGAEAAAYGYFGLKDTSTKTAAQQLDIAQAATLAGIPSEPFGRDPMLNRQASLARMQDVLTQMNAQGYITPQQKAEAIVEAQKPDFLHPGKITNTLAPSFTSYSLSEAASDLHIKVSDLSRAGVVLKTTLNLKVDQQLQKDAAEQVALMKGPHNIHNVASVVIDYHNGNIIALVGNANPDDPATGDFDVMTDGFRQPGSSFKPFVYGTAFQQKVLTPGAIVEDTPLSVTLSDGEVYAPLDYSQKFLGAVTMRFALQNSLNIPAVRTIMQVGVSNVINTIQNLGITNFEGTPTYSSALGSLSVHGIDMAEAYAAFANQGVQVPKHSISQILDQSGKVVYKPSVKGKRVLSPETAFLLTNVLSDNNSREDEFGLCSSLYLFTSTTNQCYAGHPGTVYPAAVKTGTTNSFVDNWTIGYNQQDVVAVWAGNNDNSQMNNVTGVDGAAPVWQQIMLYMEQGLKPVPFPGPPADIYKPTASSDWTFKY